MSAETKVLMWKAKECLKHWIWISGMYIMHCMTLSFIVVVHIAAARRSSKSRMTVENSIFLEYVENISSTEKFFENFVRATKMEGMTTTKAGVKWERIEFEVEMLTMVVSWASATAATIRIPWQTLFAVFVINFSLFFLKKKKLKN